MTFGDEAGHRQADLLGLAAHDPGDGGLDARHSLCPLLACGDVFVGTDHR
jgi:hypothetical protein